MWREQLDIFWDGARALAIGCFDGAERAPPVAARPELTVVSARDAELAEDAALVEVIDAARWRASPCVVELPREHGFVGLRAPDGAELRLALASEKDKAAPTGGEWRLLLTLLPEAGGSEPLAYRIATLSARGDFERLAREQVALCGARLVWAIGQRRVVERQDLGPRLVHVWPTRRVFPAWQSRIVLEPVEIANEGGETQQAPFAIMDHWLRENGAPRVTLRVRVPDSLEESANLLNRASVALVMHQRRRLKDWMQEQKNAGEPVIDPLTFDDIRQATGEPDEHPDAVAAPDAIVVANLLRLVANPDDPDYDGFAVRRLAEGAAPGLGAAVDIEFYGAALGDDVGLVSAAAEAGDLGVAPSDPGGAAYVRLFRVEGDGLTPRRVGDDDPLLDEILRRAADQEGPPTGAAARTVAERAAGLQGRRDKLIASLNGALARAEYPGRFDIGGAWDVFEPLLLSSFAALVAEAGAPGRAALQKLGGFTAYRVDPALVSAMARRPEFAEGADAARLLAGERQNRALPFRYARVGVADGLVAQTADLDALLKAWRLLLRMPRSDRLRMARIELGGGGDETVDAAAVADQLCDEALVERAAVHFEEIGLLEAAAALADYLDARREGRWTPLGEAAGLAGLIERARAEWRQAEEEAELAAAEAAREEPPPEKPKGFLAAVRGFFGG